jgi:predicted GNAT superfamily acetyltransferase
MTGVVVRDLVRIEDLRAAETLFAATWPGQPPATAGLLKALVHAGGYVSGAYASGELVGAAAAFLAEHGGPALHSHLAAVPPAARGLGVGLALKLHQRDWAAARGLHVVTWTFDPLVRRNAWFNLAKLGAKVTAYLPDFYGRMDDGVNDGAPTDRLLAVWDVWTESPPPAPGDGAPAALEEVDGAPVARAVAPDAALVAVATPADVEALRRTDPALATRWRFAVREALEPLLASGSVAGFTRGGSYLVRRGTGSA